MVLMGLGMGFISTPATESILLVLPPARAGVGSAVNDATRELGGTLGVAVVGSVFSSRVRRAPRGRRCSAGSPAARWRRPRTRSASRRRSAGGRAGAAAALQDAFMDGLHTSCLVVGVLCLVGAVVAAFTLPGRVVEPADESPVIPEPVAAWR